MSREYKRMLLRDTKNGSDRFIGINKELHDALKEYVEIYRPKTDLPYLFVKSDSSKLTKDRIAKRLKYLFDKAGFDGLTHSLRRGCFSYYAIERNVPLAKLKYISGHSDTKILEECYINPNIDSIIDEQCRW